MNQVPSCPYSLLYVRYQLDPHFCSTLSPSRALRLGPDSSAPKLNVIPYMPPLAQVEIAVSKEEQGSVVCVVDLLESDTAM